MDSAKLTVKLSRRENVVLAKDLSFANIIAAFPLWFNADMCRESNRF